MVQNIDSITMNDELEDGTETTPFSFVRPDTALMTSPVVLRAVGGLAVGLAFLAWPNRTDRILARLVGAALVWLAITGLRTAADPDRRNWLTIGYSVAALGVGLFLLVNPDRSTVFIGRLVGLGLMTYALVAAVRELRSRPRARERLVSLALTAAVGLLLVVLTDELIATVISIGAVAVILASLLSLVVSFDDRSPGAASYGDITELLTQWLRDRPKSVDARQALYDKILYEGPTTQTRIVRFFTLMGFASVIASMGIITDSTAVVIGAMLVAPLMTPLMGMAISLVMGWPNRLTRSAVVAFGGILFAIGVGVLLGLVAPTVIDTSGNGQILARTSPTTLDLIIAIAAGAAGAYGLSRPDVSDSLPGVAIAISLVPPLAVVGISYSQGDWIAGNGALLLFATNMIAILLVGGIMFVITGVTPIARAAENQHRVRTAAGVTLVAAVLVFGALLLNGAQIAADTFQQSAVEATIDDWLQPAESHRVVDAQVDGDTVTAVVIGPSDGLPEVPTLAQELSAELDRTITVNVSLVVEERFTATGG